MALRIPPLAAAFIVAGLMWLGSRAVPVAGFRYPAGVLVALCLALAGVAIAAMGVVSIRRAIYLSNVMALLMAPVYVIYMNRFQIRPEERALERLFAEEFMMYKARVRRWL